MEYLGECSAAASSLWELLRDLGIATDRPFAGRAKKIHGTAMDASQLDIERMIGTMIDGPVSLSRPEEEYRVVCSDDRCYVGKVIRRIDRGDFAYRNPMRRPFFHPGVMMPVTARALVNLSLVGRGDLLFDPFCGTGGVLLEGRLVGARVLGSDAEEAMIAGSRTNLPEADLFLADATAMPVRDDSIDAVVTDLPYGQSVRIRAVNMERLYARSLAEIRRVLKEGSRAVVVTHQEIPAIAEEYFEITGIFRQRVHKSLTRRIMVLQ
ncbi:MAG: methyltransferase domain-containing protein [Methanomicrobiaceae archaeon]|nr:methyltransferase domain-containing protein [Methanomicrobiaceae archaeon]